MKKYALPRKIPRTIMVLILIIVNGIVACGEAQENQYPELIVSLRQFTIDPILEQSFADFDGDGIIEGFFETRSTVDEDSHSIWYVSSEHVDRIYNEAYAFLGDIETIGNYSFQYIYGKKWDELYGVKDGEVVLLSLPEDLGIQQIYRDNDTGVIYGVEWDWTDLGERIYIHHMLAFDPDSFEFIDLNKSFVEYQDH